MTARIFEYKKSVNIIYGKIIFLWLDIIYGNIYILYFVRREYMCLIKSICDNRELTVIRI